MMKEQYNGLYANIRPDDALIEQTIDAASNVKPRPVIRYTVTAAACAAVALGSVPVLAANVPAFYDVLHKIAPETAEKFRPVQTFCEDQGIRMEVGAMYLKENTAQIYVTLQDLEGDRLNMDLEHMYSQYFLDPSERIGSGYTCRMEYTEYDPETRTLTFLIELETQSKCLLSGERAMFHVQRIVGDFMEYEGILSDVDLAELALTNTVWEDEALRNYGYGLSGSMANTEMTEEMKRMLAPTMEIALPMESTALTAIGYIDGKLHIQTRCEDREMLTNADVWLMTADGEKITSEISVSGELTSDLEKGYTDYIFEIEEEQLRECQLGGYLCKYGSGINGMWSVDFTLPEEAE